MDCARSISFVASYTLQSFSFDQMLELLMSDDERKIKEETFNNYNTMKHRIY